MAEASVEREYGCWKIPEHSVGIEYAQDVLTEIDRDVLEGFNRLRRGGIEVGGVLFGVHNDRTVTIRDFRAFQSEHALGPSFVLSSNDQVALAVLLANSNADAGLQGLVPVGWYHSHTRSHIHLTALDVEIFNRHFPETWQVALVLRPDHFQPTKAGFFFREQDGGIHAESSYQEFSLPPLRPPQPVKTDRDMLMERANQNAPSSRIGASPALQNEFFTRAPNQSADRRKAVQIAFLALLILAVGWSWIVVQRSADSRREFLSQPAGSPRNLSLTLEDQGGRLRIIWDRAAAPIRENPGGVLEIRDGDGVSRLDLDSEQLHRGTVLYNRGSQNVAVSLRVGGLEENAVFVGPPTDVYSRERSRGLADIPSGDRQLARINELEQLVDALNRKVGAPRDENVPVKKPGVRKSLPPVLLSRRPERVISIPVPTFETISSPPPVSAPLIGTLPAVPPVRSSAPSPSAPAAPAPVLSGTLIWTGRLPNTGVLSINGNRASTGSLTGEIPARPVRVTVYPAELTKDGLKIYSSNPKHEPGHSEPPAARNGWNKTSYVRDTRLTGAVKVVEAPRAENNWNRLVLRDEGAKSSVLVIEWDTL